MYGIVSLAAALPMARSLVARLTREDLVALVKLALVGNLLYYMLLATAVQMVGVAPSSLIVGILPVTVTLAGRRDHGAVPLARLVWPLAMVLAGIVCINVDVFSVAGRRTATSGEHRDQARRPRVRGGRASPAGPGSRSRTPAICNARPTTAATSGQCCGAW